MNENVQMVNENTQEGSFLRAVLAIRENDFERAHFYINKVNRSCTSGPSSNIGYSQNLPQYSTHLYLRIAI